LIDLPSNGNDQIAVISRSVIGPDASSRLDGFNVGDDADIILKLSKGVFLYNFGMETLMVQSAFNVHQ